MRRFLLLLAFLMSLGLVYSASCSFDNDPYCEFGQICEMRVTPSGFNTSIDLNWTYQNGTENGTVTGASWNGVYFSKSFSSNISEDVDHVAFINMSYGNCSTPTNPNCTRVNATCYGSMKFRNKTYVYIEIKKRLYNGTISERDFISDFDYVVLKNINMTTTVDVGDSMLDKSIEYMEDLSDNIDKLAGLSDTVVRTRSTVTVHWGEYDDDLKYAKVPVYEVGNDGFYNVYLVKTKIKYLNSSMDNFTIPVYNEDIVYNVKVGVIQVEDYDEYEYLINLSDWEISKMSVLQFFIVIIIWLLINGVFVYAIIRNPTPSASKMLYPIWAGVNVVLGLLGIGIFKVV